VPVVAAPLAAPLAGAIVKGVAQGIGAALKYGPPLLQLADQFQNPGRLGGSVADTPRGQRLRELIQDALNGARVPVAQPPAPGFPPPSPLGPLGPLNPGDQAARALVERLGQTQQDWGGPNGRPTTTTPQEWSDATSGVVRLPNPSGIVITTFEESRTNWVSCFDSSGGGSGSEASNTYSLSDVISVSFENAGIIYQESGCGNNESFPPTNRRIVGTKADGSQVVVSLRASSGWTGISGRDEWRREGEEIREVTVNSEPLDAPALVVPGGAPSFPFPADSGVAPLAQQDLPPQQRALPVPTALAPLADPVPLLQPLPAPGALPAPSNPAPGQPGGSGATTGTGSAGNVSPGALVGPVPTVQPLPAYVPRPVPGRSDPSPQPSAFPQRRIPSPSRPTLPGVQPDSSPGTTPQPFPGVPVEPGQVPAPAPGPSPGPSPAPGPAPGPAPAPGPGVAPGAVPQPGPAAPPLPIPGTTPVEAPVTTPTTPADQHFPIPGAAPVTGNGPAPTLVAMAQEMGRQENKLNRVLRQVENPTGSPQPGPDLGDLLRPLIDLLLTADGPGEYALNSPCNIDENTGDQGEDLVAKFGPSVGIIGALAKRLDALAELHQFQKDLPQPTCKRRRPVGEIVSVNFEEI